MSGERSGFRPHSHSRFMHSIAPEQRAESRVRKHTCLVRAQHVHARHLLYGRHAGHNGSLLCQVVGTECQRHTAASIMTSEPAMIWHLKSDDLTSDI